MLCKTEWQRFPSYVDLLVSIRKDASQWFEKNYGKSISEAVRNGDPKIEHACRRMLHEAREMFFILEEEDDHVMLLRVTPDIDPENI